MFSPTTLALAYSISAGLMNGSFVLPTKHVKSWPFENIWLVFSFWTFLVFPWITIFLMDSQIGHAYRLMPMNTLLLLLGGGFLFGVGQVCFTLALRTIGLGLSFVINIGLGTGLGSLLPLLMLDKKNILTSAGIATLLGVTLVILGLLLSYSAGKQRDKEHKATRAIQNKTLYTASILLVILAGLFSAGQNYIFAMTGNMQQIALAAGADPLAASIIIWPPFLAACFIPYALYMLYLHLKNHSFQFYQQSDFLKNNLLGSIMGIFWFGSLAIYSKASLLIGALGPIIAWPLFMVAIILTSTFWSWYHKEWAHCSSKIKRRMIVAICALVLAVMVLTYGASLSH